MFLPKQNKLSLPRRPRLRPSRRAQKALRERIERQTDSQRSRLQVPYDIGDALISPRNNRMYEQFLLMGTTEGSGDVLEVLFSYPYGLQGEQDFSLAVMSVCDVAGRTRGLAARYSSIFLSPPSHESNSFVMNLRNERQQLVYAVCVTNDEPWDYYLTGSHRYHKQLPQARSWKEESTDPRDLLVASIRYYCLITSNTSLCTHFSLLHDIIDRERLNFNQRMHLSRELSDGSSASVFYMLRTYYSMSAPPCEQGLSFKIQHNIRDTSFFIPAGDSQELLADWCLPGLRQLLPPGDILWLLGYLLQEYSVLVHGSSACLVSKLVLSMVVMMRPYAWPGTVCPVLGPALEDIVDCPTPVLAGVLNPQIGVQRCQPHMVHLQVSEDGCCCKLMHPCLPAQGPGWRLPQSASLLEGIQSTPASQPRRLSSLFRSYHLEMVLTLACKVEIGSVFGEQRLAVDISSWLKSHVRDARERLFWERMLASQRISQYNALLASCFLAAQDVRHSREALQMGKQQRRARALSAIEAILCPKECYQRLPVRGHKS